MMHLEGRDKSNMACGHYSYRKISLDNIDDKVEVIKKRLSDYFEKV